MAETLDRIFSYQLLFYTEKLEQKQQQKQAVNLNSSMCSVYSTHDTVYTINRHFLTANCEPLFTCHCTQLLQKKTINIRIDKQTQLIMSAYILSAVCCLIDSNQLFSNDHLSRQLFWIIHFGQKFYFNYSKNLHVVIISCLQHVVSYARNWSIHTIFGCYRCVTKRIQEMLADTMSVIADLLFHCHWVVFLILFPPLL